MKGKVVSNYKLNEKYWQMDIQCAEFCEQAEVGQFLMIQPGLQDYLSDPLLRRPFGVADVRGDVFSIVYMLVGKGTLLLTEVKTGTDISFSVPVGNGFRLKSGKKVALAAGGVGIAPMLMLAKELKNAGCETTLFYGGRSEDDIILLNELEKHTDKIFITTNDGTLGRQGMVTEPMAEMIDEFDHVYACGPKMMLRAVSEVAVSGGKPVDVSLDERMACGMGACLGCIIYVMKDGEETQQRCCVEGPVFDGATVVWESVCKG